MKELSKAFWGNKQGAAAAEAALILPVFLLLGLGAADFGNLLLQKQRVNTGLITAANYLARAESPDSVEALAKNIAVTGSPTGGSARVNGWSVSQVQVNYASISNNGNYRGLQNVRTATFTTELDYEGFGLVTMITRRTVKIRAQHSERLTGEKV